MLKRSYKTYYSKKINSSSNDKYGEALLVDWLSYDAYVRQLGFQGLK